MDNVVKKIVSVYIGLSLIFLLVLYSLAVDYNYFTMFYMAAFIVITSVIVMIINNYYLRYIVHQKSRKRCELIDKVVENRGYDLNLSEETIESREDNKLKELVNILVTEKEKYEGEKRKLQSLITDLSHQVKTPLTNISMYNATLLERELPKERQIEFLKLIEAQALKLRWLIDGLIKISRLESEIISLKSEKYTIENLVAMSLAGVYFDATKKNIKMEVNVDEKIKGFFDIKWTSEAIINIVENAIKYSKEGSEIKIGCEAYEMFVKLTIEDEGIGIHNEELNKVFERFYRSDRTCDISGLGIGLYLAREIINREGGYIKVKSEEDKGSIFSVYLLKDEI